MDYQQSLFDQKPKPNRKPFKGADYVESRDYQRLDNQLGRIWRLMKDGQWRTLAEISELANAPPASVSAQLRHLKKPAFGSHTLEKEHLGNGLYRYRIIPNPKANP